MPFFFRVRAVDCERVDTEFPDAFKFIESMRHAFLIIFDSEIREVHHVADRSFQDNACCFGNRVRNAEKFSFKRIRYLYYIPVFNDLNIKLGTIREIVLTFLYDCFCNRSSINQWIA